MTPEEIAAAAAAKAAEEEAAKEAAEKAAKEAEEAAAAAAAAKGKPTDAEAKLLKDLMKQKETAAAAQAEVNRLKAEVAKFDGIDPVKVRELLEAQAEAERKKAEAAGDYDRLKKQMADAHAAEKKKIADDLEATRGTVGQLNAQIAELTVGQAFASSKFVAEDLTLTVTKARVVYGSHFEFKDGKVVGYDKPSGASERTMLVNATGEPLVFEEALKKLVDADPDKDSLLKSKIKSGAGSSTAPKGAGKVKSGEEKPISSVEKIQRGLAALAKKQSGR